MDKWLRRYDQNTETCGSRKVIKNVKRWNKAIFDQIPYTYPNAQLDLGTNLFYNNNEGAKRVSCFFTYKSTNVFAVMVEEFKGIPIAIT